MYQQQEILEELDAKNLIDTDLLIEKPGMIDIRNKATMNIRNLALVL